MAVYPLVIIVTVLGVNTFTHLLRRRLERINQTVRGISENRYVAHIQGPAAAVFLASGSAPGSRLTARPIDLVGGVRRCG